MNADMMSGFDLYSNLITLFCGIYCLYTGIKLKMKGELFPNQLLLPKDTKPEDCLDQEGYIAYIAPRLLVAGVIYTLVGVISLVVSRLDVTVYFPQYPELASYVNMGGIVLSLISLVWLVVCWMKSKKLFWL